MGRRSAFGAISNGMKYGLLAVGVVVIIIIAIMMFSKSSTPAPSIDSAPSASIDSAPSASSEPAPSAPVVQAPSAPVVQAPVVQAPVVQAPVVSAPTPIGQGMSKGNRLYASGAWELLKTGEPRTIASSFSDPLYSTWVGRAYEIVKNKYPEATSFTVWRDAGYRVYSGTATPLQYPNDTFMQTFTYP